MTAPRLPPGGRRLRELRRGGLIPSSGGVKVGIGWNLLRHTRSDALILPPGENPAGFDWRVVAGLDVVIVVNKSDMAVADALARLLIVSGAVGCIAWIFVAGEWVDQHIYKSCFQEIRRAA